MKTKPTQMQMYESARRKISEAHKVFLDMQASDHPITKDEWEKLNAVRPELWGQFRHYFEGEGGGKV